MSTIAKIEPSDIFDEILAQAKMVIVPGIDPSQKQVILARMVLYETRLTETQKIEYLKAVLARDL